MTLPIGQNQSQSEPKKPNESQPPNNTPDLALSKKDLDFREVVAKSKAEIQATKMQNFEVVKRGPGRPKGVKNRPKTDQNPTISTQNQGQNEVPAAPMPDLSPFFEAPLIAVSKIPAAKYDIPELALSKDEAGACAIALNQVLNAFAPNMAAMSPQTAAIIGALSTFGSIGFSKYQIYLAKIEERTAEAKSTADDANFETTNVEPAPGPLGVVHASEFYR